MEYILEIYYEGDCIEQRKQPDMFIAPAKGETISLQFENPYYLDEYGSWWIVRERRHLLFSSSSSLQTLQLFCEPDPNKGAHPL